MSWLEVEQRAPKVSTNIGKVVESMKVGLSKSSDVDGDEAADHNQIFSSNEKVESWHNRGSVTVQEEDGDNEVDDDEDDDDEEGDNDDIETNHPTDSNTDGYAHSTVNSRRKKVRKRRRVRKRNINSGNEINDGSHHSTNYVVEGAKALNPSSSCKGSNVNVSSQQVQPNQKSKKPHDAPMTKSDLYYAIRIGMVQVEVDVMQSIPKGKLDKNDSSDCVVVATIVRDVIGRVLLVNWDNVTVYDSFVAPELSSTQQALLQEEFKACKPSKWTGPTGSMVNELLPFTFQVKRIIDYRSDQTGIVAQDYSTASMVSISELKPILKKFVKGKIVIGYNVQADLQVIDGMVHPKSDVRDVAQFGPYMNIIVTARPMSLQTSQDKQRIVHYEPTPLSLLLDTYETTIDPCNESNAKINHGLLYKEAVGCLHLYKRLRSEWEDELCRLSRHRYKFPPMSVKSATASPIAPLPPPVAQHAMMIPVQQIGTAQTKQYYQHLSTPMMNIPPTNLPHKWHKSLPTSAYHQSAMSYTDRGLSVTNYEDRRHAHQSNPTFSEQQGWSHDHASAVSLDPPFSLPSSRYQTQHQNILPVNSPTPHSPHRSYFGQTKYEASPSSWEIQRHSESSLRGTERLSSGEGRRWSNSPKDVPTVKNNGIARQVDPWCMSSSFQLPDTSDRISDNQASMILSGDTTTNSEQRPFSNLLGLRNHRSSFENTNDTNDGMQPTPPSTKNWSPLLTDSFSLLSALNNTSTGTSSCDTVPPAPFPPLHPSSTSSTIAQLDSNNHAFLRATRDSHDSNSSMFQWDALLSSINDTTTSIEDEHYEENKKNLLF